MSNRSPMNEHRLAILKLKLAGVILLFVALGILRLCAEAA